MDPGEGGLVLEDDARRHAAPVGMMQRRVIGSLYKRIITDWELTELRHPTHRVKLFKIGVRERFLSPEERQRVHEAIEAGLKIPAGRKGHLEPRSVWALQLLSLNGPARPTHRPPRGDRAGPPSLTVAEVVMRHEHAFAGRPLKATRAAEPE